MANEFKVKKGLIVDGSNTVLDVQGTSGQLFSVTDSLTGDLFSVSDVSGIPILNVNSSGAVEVDGNLGINATPTTNAIEIDGADGTSYVHFKSDAATTGARVGLNSDDLIIENKQATGDMIFDTAATERFRIASGGDATFTGTISSKEISIKQQDDTGFDAGLTIERSANTQKVHIGMDGGAVNFNSPDGLSYKFRNNGTEKFTVDGSGNATFASTAKATTFLINRTTAAGVGVSLGDINGAELGPGYLSLSRDDTADAKQIVFEKNDGEHSYLQTTADGLEIKGNGVHFSTDDTFLSNYNYTFRDAVGITNPNATSAASNSNTVMSIGARSGGTVNTSLITTGAVGIGTTSPTTLLHVAGGTNFSANAMPAATANFMNNFNSYLGLLIKKDGTSTGDYLSIQDSSANTQLIVKSSGNVGIGSSSPESKLVIKDDGFSTASNTKKGLFFDNSSVAASNGNIGNGIEFGKLGNGGSTYKKSAIVPVQGGADSDNLGIAFFVSNSSTQAAAVEEAMRINYDKNATFEGEMIVGASNMAMVGIEFSTTNLRIKPKSSLANGRIWRESNYLIYDSPSAGHKFAVAGNASTNVALTIDSSQDATFAGSVTVDALELDYNTSYYNQDKTISAYSASNYVYVNGTGGTDGLGLRLMSKGAATNIIGLENSNNSIFFNTNSTLALTIDSSQNATFTEKVQADHLGLGTAASAFGSGVPTLDFKGTSSTNGRAGAIRFKENDGTDTAALYVTDGGDGYGTVLCAYQGDLKFATGSLTGTKLTINSSGDATLTRALNIVGTAATLGMSSNATQVVDIIGDTGDSNARLRIQFDSVNDDLVGAAGKRTFIGDGASDIVIGTNNSSYSPNNSFISLEHDGKIRMAAGASPTLASEGLTIDTDGSVGIGTGAPSAKFEVQGTSGQLFSITDSLTGDLFSVADVSGIPILNVNSSGLVEIDDALELTNTTSGQITLPDSRMIASKGTDGVDNAILMHNGTRTFLGSATNSAALYVEGNNTTLAGDVLTPGLYVNATSAVAGTQAAIVSSGSSENLMRWGSSTDGGSQHSYRFRIDQNFHFIGNSGSGDMVTIESNTGHITTSGDIAASQLTVDDYIYHAGDSNTYIYFTPDNIKLRTGGDDRLELSNTAATFAGTVKAYGNSDTTPAFEMYSDSNHGMRILHRGTDGDFGFERRLNGTNTEFLRVGRANGNATFRGQLTGESYVRSLDTYQITLDSVDAAGPKIEFGATNDWDAYGSIGHQGGQYQFGTHSRDFAWLNGTTELAVMTTSGELQLVSNLTTDNTVIYENDNGTRWQWGSKALTATNKFGGRYHSGSGWSSLLWSINSSGNVAIAGALSKGSGSFKIDHPLESKKDTHDLVHSFIEGPQADLIYRGKVDLVDGQAEVNIDTEAGMTEGTFVLLNTNVQCFTTNESNWDLVKGSVSGNILTIESQNTSSTATISWMVVGERQDQHMIDTDWTDENGKIIVEPRKVE